jgi:hypothetical protein
MQLFPRESMLNWSSAVDTYPRFVRCLSMDSYREHIFEGLTSSIGSLSESVSKVSSSNLIKWAKDQKTNKNKRQLGLILRLVTALFAKYHDSNRELVSIHKTLGLLLSNNIWSYAEGEDTSDMQDACEAARVSVRNCKQVDRLLASIDVFITLLTFAEPLKKKGMLINCFFFKYIFRPPLLC